MKKIGITETILRDGHQSLIATRMTTEEMLPALELMDNVGYNAIECWGGATFDVCMRFLEEDPWDRLRKIRASVKNTKLQMLLRGQNLLGYKNYADDVVEYFVKKSIANGIDIIRIFDALNDFRNIETAIDACKKEGGHAQATICYTTSPVHTIDGFVEDAKRLKNMGADSLCIKDMAGILLPYTAYDLIKRIKEEVDLPIELHTHYTAGTGSMTYLKAVESGCDILDTALTPFALGTSQPATESIVATLSGTEFDTGLDLSKLGEISNYFSTVKEKYIKNGTLDSKVMSPDANVLIYQVPGGMLSNLVSQLKQQNAMDKYKEVLEEVPRVREDMGFPPLVTPSSQIIGTQAVLNVIMGERYKMVTKETKALVRGEYGKTPKPISDEIIEKILGSKEEVITCRPANRIMPELDNMRKEMNGYFEQDEDVLSYALFPGVATEFFKYRQAEKYGIESDFTDFENKVTIV
jgi:oxaloacetate decarboxylase alpha subunit